MKKLVITSLFSILIFFTSAQEFSVNLGLNSTSSSQFWKRSSISAMPGISFGSSASFDLTYFSKIKVTASYFSNKRKYEYENSWFYNYTHDLVTINSIKLAPTFHFMINDELSIFSGFDYSIPISGKSELISDSSGVIDTYELSNFDGTTAVNFGVSYLLYYMLDFELGCSLLDYRRQNGSSYFDYNLYFTIGYIL